MQVAVIGAGIIGVSCALALQARGAEVVIYDRDGPAAGASRGNAGVFATYAVVPEFTPGLLKQLPRMLLDPQGPLSIRLRYLPFLVPWGLRALAASRPERVAEVTEALGALLSRVTPDADALLARTGTQDLRRDSGGLHIFRTEAARRSHAAEWEEMARLGVAFRALDGDGIRALEPAISERYSAGYQLLDLQQTVNPEQLVRRLFAAFLKAGGRFEQAEVQALDGQGLTARITLAGGEIRRHPQVVVAAGIHSVALCRSMDLRLPLQAERGYNTTIPNPGVRLTRPTCVVESGYYMSPMDMGLRIGGKVELAGTRAGARWSRARVMARHAQKVLPGLSVANGRPWMGLRPSTPDSLPVIGPVPGHPAVTLACGHSHLGLTLSAPTGTLVADLLGGRAPAIDPAPYGVERFL